MNIDNLTEEQIAEIADLYCMEAFGFEGAETFPNCEECVICLCKKKMSEVDEK